MAINPLAIGGGVVAAAAVVGGGLYAGGVFSGGSGDKQTRKEPAVAVWKPLSEDSDFANVYGTSDTDAKYGKTYGRYMASVNDRDATKLKNLNKWWEEKFTDVYKKEVTAPTDAFSGLNDKEALKNKCVEAYKEKLHPGSNNGKIKASSPQAGEFLESNIWKFCSPIQSKIETIKDASEDYTPTDAYGKKQEYQSLLIAAGTDKNNNFWTFQQEAIKNIEGLTTNSEFKKLQDKIKGGTAGNSDTVRSVCAAAYAKTETNPDNNHPKSDIFKVCSLSGTVPN